MISSKPMKNKGFPSERDKLLLLIRSAIFPNTCNEISAIEYNWGNLLMLAKEQAVMGLLFHAIENIPKEILPPRDVLLELIGVSETIKRRNRQVDEVLVSSVEELRECDIECVVIKGQVIAQEYERPELRQSGDIDVFIAEMQWNKLSQWLDTNGYHYSKTAPDKHIEINYRGVHLELHWHLKVFASSAANKYWLDNVERPVLLNCRMVNVAGCKIRTLGTIETIVYLLVHAHTHLLRAGIGLRQLIDMTLFLNNHFDEIDFYCLKQHLYGIGYYKAFTAYCALMNKYLGLPKDKIPYELDFKDYVYADKIMEEVWHGGNFGHKNDLNGVKSGLLHSLNTARLVFTHSWKFYRLAPAEARGYWWSKVFWRMKRKA